LQKPKQNRQIQAMAEILSTDSREKFDAAVRRAAELLRAGEVVALPTETVYGLAANAFDEAAVARIFEVKGRPANNPIIVHVASRDLAEACVSEWTEAAEQLAKSFWPGPLTIVLPKSAKVPVIVTGGGPTVGVRWPAHPFVQAVIGECGFPLAAPSANPANQLSPTTAEHVQRSLGHKVSLVIDGGPAHVGIESTVVDASVTPPRLLRPGVIHRESLLAVLGELAGDNDNGAHRKSPGTFPRHYSPRARLMVCAWENERELREIVTVSGVAAADCHIIAHSRIPEPQGLGGVSLIPHDPAAYARALYAELHKCDEMGAELIIVETVPESGEWHAIFDRLRRAQTQ
jgi:L-threonylcarbamoyladenylate synthase